MNGYTVHTIERKDAKPWIMKKHYAKRMPAISHSFGLFKNNLLQGILTYGLPASPSLCRGICGDKYKNIVIEYNRLCLENNCYNEASFFTAKTFKLLPKPKIIVSYSDTAQNHIGYVYQATNWIYTGLSEIRTDPKHDIGNKHTRHTHVIGLPQIKRPRKHRYIYFIGSKKQKKEMLKALRYPVLPYPKGESKRYDTSATFAKQVQMF